MDSLMQLVADDGMLCHGLGIAIQRNPYKHHSMLGWAWEMGWKEASFVSQSKNKSRKG